MNRGPTVGTLPGGRYPLHRGSFGHVLTHSFPTRRSSDLDCRNPAWGQVSASSWVIRPCRCNGWAHGETQVASHRLDTLGSTEAMRYNIEQSSWMIFLNVDLARNT